MPSQLARTSPEARLTRRAWLLPALTFLAGCLLGAVVMGVGDVGGKDEPSASAAATAADGGSDQGDDGTTDDATTDGLADDATTDGTTGDGEEAGRSVRVPESCLQTADDAAALVEQVDRVVAAVADLDPERLRQTVDDVQQVRDGVQDMATQCRDAAADGLQDSGAGTEPADVEGDAPTTPSS